MGKARAAWNVLLLAVLMSLAVPSQGARADTGPDGCAAVTTANTLEETPADQLRPLSTDHFLDLSGSAGAVEIAAQRFAPGPCNGIFQAPGPGQAQWFRFTVVNRHADDRTWFIGFQEIVLDDVAVFERRGDRLVAGSRDGRTVPAVERASGTMKTGVPLRVAAGQETTFYLRVAGTYAPNLTPAIVTPKLFQSWSTAVLTMMALYMGFLLALILFSLILFRHVDISLYFYYPVYLSCLFTFSFFWDGWLHHFGGATLPVTLAGRIALFFIGAGVLALIQYCRVLLRIHADPPAWRGLFVLLSGLTLITTGLAVVDPWDLAIWLRLTYLGSSLVLVVVCLKKVRDGLAQAKAIAAALFCFLAGLAVANYFFLFPIRISGASSAFQLILMRPLAYGYYFAVFGEAVFMMVAISIMVKAMQAQRRSAVAAAKALQRDVIAAESRHAAALKATDARIQALESRLAESADGDGSASTGQALVARATDCVLDQVDQDGFGVRELAAALGLSEKTLGRRLKDARGLTPAAFIRAIRLGFARDLIRLRQHQTVAEIAYAAGFSSTGYFAKLYRQEFGETPSEAFRSLKALE